MFETITNCKALEKQSWTDRAKLFGMGILSALAFAGGFGVNTESASAKNINHPTTVENKVKTPKKTPSKYECEQFIDRTALVNLSKQKMKICEDGEVISSSNILSGRVDGPTPTGRFKIQRVRGRTVLTGRNFGKKYKSGEEKDWRDYRTVVDSYRDFNGPAYGFHPGDTSQRIAKLRGKKVGSRGCVRVAKIDTLKQMEVGTPVIIYYDNIPSNKRIKSQRELNNIIRQSPENKKPAPTIS
jgi:L,D-transpeptidase catalytic domain